MQKRGIGLRCSRLITTANPDIQRWNDRYESSNRDSEKFVDPVGEPELIDHVHYLNGQGLAIEIACGKGANALYLASLGYQVVACDGALSGLEICQRSARRLELPVYHVVCDVDALVLPQNEFSLISVVRYLQRSLFDKIVSALTPGGLIFYKTFNTNMLAHKPGFNRDYLVKVGELDQVFSSLEILASDCNVNDPGTADAKTTSYILGRKHTR